MRVVVIPAFVETALQAAQLLRSAAAAAQAGVARVIVVDDASPVAVRLAVPGVEILRRESNGGAAAARNRGIERALELGARLVLFTDVDCVPAPDWADAHTRFLDRTDHLASGGVTRALGATLLDRYHDFAGTLNGRWLLPGHEALLYAPTCNLAVRSALLAHLRFDERFPHVGEDVDFGVRLGERGTIGLATEAVVRHDFGYASAVAGLPAFVRQFRRYGGGEQLLHERHAHLRDQRVEGCAPEHLLSPAPVESSGYRRASLGRVRPRRLRPALALLKRVARAAFQTGRASPPPWRTVEALDGAAPTTTAGAEAPAPSRRAVD
jgi:glycosyltransferase involved in cell wall biosynthesis